MRACLHGNDFQSWQNVTDDALVQTVATMSRAVILPIFRLFRAVLHSSRAWWRP
jgi:hypothetical protein